MPKLPKLPALKAAARREGWAEWIQSERDERAVLAGMRFDLDRVERARQFGRRFLRLWEDPFKGLPFEWMDWQYHDLFGPLFGWVRWSADYNRWVRRYKHVYCEVAKKNGKSPTGAYIGLYMLVGDQEGGASVFSAATTKGQAGVVHNHAIKMVRASPRLMDLLEIHKSTATISHEASNSVYRALPGVAGVNEGLNASCIINDELHVWKGRDLWDALKYAFASRAEPILMSITTAGTDTESVCYEQHSYSKAVIAGDIEDLTFLPLIYAADEGDDESKESTWRKANPSLGHSITVAAVRDEYNAAKASPAALAGWRRYRLNRWLSSETVWLPPNAWNKCGQDYGPEDLAGRTCYGGLDLATVNDLSSLALVFPDDLDPDTDPLDNHYWALWWHWWPQATVDKWRGRLPVDEWIGRGWLEVTPGDATDFGFITRRILEVRDQFELVELAFDPWKADQFTQQLQLEHGIQCVAVPPTIPHFAEPTAELERRIVMGNFGHPNNRLVTWQSRHCTVTVDANGNKRPVKPKPHSMKKIDGMTAVIMAFGRAWKSGGQQWPDADDYELESF